MVLTNIEKQIKKKLEENNNNPLYDRDFSKIRNKRKLLSLLNIKGYGKKFKIGFTHTPLTYNIVLLNDNTHDDYDLKDILKSYKFTGEWKKLII